MKEERILYELGKKYGVNRVGIENPFVQHNLRPVVYIDVRKAFRTPDQRAIRLYLVYLRPARDGFVAETDLRMEIIEQAISLVRVNFEYWYNQKRSAPLLLEDVLTWDFDNKNVRLAKLPNYSKLKQEFIKQSFCKR